jgi:serine/threonine-protein kinase ATR
LLIPCKFDDALRLLASLTPRKRGPSSESSLGVGPFIEEHLFGLITEFVDTVNDLHARYPVIEKKRNIIAIGEMIKLAPNHVNAAIPQVCLAI